MPLVPPSGHGTQVTSAPSLMQRGGNVIPPGAHFSRTAGGQELSTTVEKPVHRSNTSSSVLRRIAQSQQFFRPDLGRCKRAVRSVRRPTTVQLIHDCGQPLWTTGAVHPFGRAHPLFRGQFRDSVFSCLPRRPAPTGIRGSHQYDTDPDMAARDTCRSLHSLCTELSTGVETAGGLRGCHVGRCPRFCRSAVCCAHPHRVWRTLCTLPRGAP